MAKYNKYAQAVRDKFLEAREQYARAYEKLQHAEEQVKKAHTMTETFVGEKSARIAETEARLKLVQAEFKSVSDEIWGTFDREKKKIDAELRAAVRADNLANSDRLDANALELLKSGIMSGDDYEAMLSGFDGNSTMRRMIAKYAAAAADDKNRDPAERAQLSAVANAGRDGGNTVLRSWEDFLASVHTLSGQSHGRGAPEYVTMMNNRFESLLDGFCEGF